jgi:hypothetical protein
MRMSRSHGGTVPAVTSQDLLSEASSPGSDVPCRERRAGRGGDAPAKPLLLASPPFLRGRRRLLAGRSPRTTGLTSSLSGCFGSCSRVTRFVMPPHLRRLADFARSVHFPRSHLPFASRPQGPDLLAGWSRREKPLRSGLRSSNLYPLGNCVGPRFETSLAPDWAWRGF